MVPWTVAARWQLKVLRSPGPGFQVEPYLLQQDLAAEAKIKVDSSARPMLIRLMKVVNYVIIKGSTGLGRLPPGSNNFLQIN